MHLRVFHLVSSVLICTEIHELQIYVFSQVWEIFSSYCFKYFVLRLPTSSPI